MARVGGACGKAKGAGCRAWRWDVVVHDHEQRRSKAQKSAAPRAAIPDPADTSAAHQGCACARCTGADKSAEAHASQQGLGRGSTRHSGAGSTWRGRLVLLQLLRNLLHAQRQDGLAAGAGRRGRGQRGALHGWWWRGAGGSGGSNCGRRRHSAPKDGLLAIGGWVSPWRVSSALDRGRAGRARAQGARANWRRCWEWPTVLAQAQLTEVQLKG